MKIQGILALVVLMILILHVRTVSSEPKTGNVIFIHPDGSSASAWAALRCLTKGPDGSIHWDKMSDMGVYRGHLANSIVSSSNGGATVHAFGIKADRDAYGNHSEFPIKSLSGKDYSIMIEAQKAGKPIGIINSGHIAEPGSGIFVSNASSRKMTDTIAEQIIRSNADVIFSGGEVLMLPKVVMGRHGKEGIREDGKNIVEMAKKMGYTIVYDRQELMNIAADTEKVLGIFAAKHTFNADHEEVLNKKGLPHFNPEAPSLAEMTEVALKILKNKGKDFLLVIEEEGSDNFANKNNSSGTLEALRRADDAIGVAMDYVKNNPRTMIITGADSNAGGMQVHRVKETDKLLPPTVENGAPLDGKDGTGTMPFIAAPDKAGVQFPFGICWANYSDLGGGIISKAHGLNAELLPNNVDNTDIYRMMYLTLFGVWLD